MSDEFESDSTTPAADDCQHPAALLLPWLVNGTLSATDQQWVREHLRDCRHCRMDLARERLVHEQVRQAGSLELAPQPGLQKLLARVDAVVAQKTENDPSPDSRALDLPAESAAAPVPPHERASLAPRHVRWLVAAVVVQAVGLGVLATIMSWRQSAPSVTVATPVAVKSIEIVATAPVVSAHDPALIRVMFSGKTSVRELRELLSRSALCIIDGPSESGLYTLRVDKAVPANANDSARIVADTVAALRGDTRVVFAEPLALTAKPL